MIVSFRHRWLRDFFRFQQLKGNLEGFHSIRINQRWRLVFRWDADRGEAGDVYLDDHSYK